jgi:hypothetical protein
MPAPPQQKEPFAEAPDDLKRRVLKGASAVASTEAARSWLSRIEQQYGVTLDGSSMADAVPEDQHYEMVQSLILITLHLLPPPKDAAQPVYTAYERDLLRRTLVELSIPPKLLYSVEKALAQEFYFILEQNTKEPSSSESTFKSGGAAALASSLAKGTTWKRVATGAGFVAGGALIGLTGGLAAPLIAPLLVTISGGTLAFLGTAGGSIVLGTLFGLGGGNRESFHCTGSLELTWYQVAAKRVNRRVQGIDVCSLLDLSAVLRPVQQFEFVELEDPDLPLIPSLHVSGLLARVAL